MRRSGFKRKSYKEALEAKIKSDGTKKGIKRVKKVRVAGHETAKELKKEIQELLREIVILRDKKCILHGIKCNHEVGMQGVVWQAEHLIERSNSATYADVRLVVLVCRNCHGWKHFTKSNHDQYDKWVKTKLSPDRIKLWDKCQNESWTAQRMGAYDWKMAIIYLKKVLELLTNTK